METSVRLSLKENKCCEEREREKKKNTVGARSAYENKCSKNDSIGDFVLPYFLFLVLSLVLDGG